MSASQMKFVRRSVGEKKLSAPQMRFASHLRTKKATRTKITANNKLNFTRPSSLIFCSFLSFLIKNAIERKAIIKTRNGNKTFIVSPLSLINRFLQK
ncbi:hypothetical protein [Cytobacillus kochii]|uniref:hypothetical protein n=1 Tax=Cytobacillus kochii TaxID=859143 RepID=UPI00203C22A8|nr:hypothetical protein [Cytobacillus kochii]MCM3323488.1 hypothetical protein [Cytobacillus kochii]MCM3345883.1 hypothetical protein [Cytobacillus kochii]